MTLLWWTIFLGLYVAIEIGCIWRVLCRDRIVAVALVGVALMLGATTISIALLFLMAQIDPNIHGGPGTGIGYVMPVVIIAPLAVHIVVMLLTAGYVASLRAEQSKKDPPATGLDS